MKSSIELDDDCESPISEDVVSSQCSDDGLDPKCWLPNGYVNNYFLEGKKKNQ